MTSPATPYTLRVHGSESSASSQQSVSLPTSPMAKDSPKFQLSVDATNASRARSKSCPHSKLGHTNSLPGSDRSSNGSLQHSRGSSPIPEVPSLDQLPPSPTHSCDISVHSGDAESSAFPLLTAERKTKKKKTVEKLTLLPKSPVSSAFSSQPLIVQLFLSFIQVGLELDFCQVFKFVKVLKKCCKIYASGLRYIMRMLFKF